MTSIEWNKLVIEFGEQAYKQVCIRVPPNRFSFEDNFQVATCEDFEEIESMPLTELFRLDVEAYGDNAFLIYGYCHFEGDVINDFSFNSQILGLIESGYSDRLIRKQSAALPFDLERAKAGDIFEVKGIDNAWFVPSESEESNSLITIFESCPNRKDLRMKYPPRISK